MRSTDYVHISFVVMTNANFNVVNITPEHN